MRKNKETFDFDVIIVGGGPAGAVSALECSKMGRNVLLMERGKRGRHKPCGGIVPPICADIISETLETSIPREVICSPETLGLYYIPPSGRKNGGSIKNYKLININRNLFDQWLCELVEESGVHVWYNTEFFELQQLESIQVLAKRSRKTVKLTTRYLIGADGIHSRVRKQLYREKKVETLPILQEYWKAKGEFDDYFYAVYGEAISPTYAYVIPKDGLYVIGTGVPKTNSVSILKCLDCFKKWLFEEFAFKPFSLERREIWDIPYGFTLEGKGNVILVGDAAGFCNPFSGEGIRLAIESGIAAGFAVQNTMSSDKSLASNYINQTEWISSSVKQLYKYAIELTDNSREDFVKSELNRVPFN